ncbi:hypothetical protein [Mycobacterium tuberculosis]|uniref:hypothetical protein n=1 Tax=Mycobacterium tuberculosis TaxID=1773 RepID=UPI003D7C80EF
MSAQVAAYHQRFVRSLEYRRGRIILRPRPPPPRADRAGRDQCAHPGAAGAPVDR